MMATQLPLIHSKVEGQETEGVCKYMFLKPTNKYQAYNKNIAHFKPESTHQAMGI